MDEAFELLDPQAAQAFLRRFPTVARGKGEALFRSGRVHDLVPKEPGVTYSALVREGREYGVYLHYDSTEGDWMATCSCPQDTNCEHVFAAMTALLAEDSTASVRSLSAGMRRRLAQLVEARWQRPEGHPKARPEAGGHGELAARLQAATGRALTRAERTFLRNLHATYMRCRQTRQMSYWDLQQLGLPLLDYSWNGLRPWPAFPSSEHEFWLYLANALQERGHAIPEFMRSITDLSLIQAPLERWRRSSEIEKWRQTLDQLQFQYGRAEAAPPPETDLRLVIEEQAARLERQAPGKATFEPLKHKQLRQLESQDQRGCLQLTPEGELLWQFFRQRLNYGLGTEVAYDHHDAISLLGRLLRVRLLESRIVNHDGQPLARPAESLRWDMAPAAGEQDDYVLRLVQANGQPQPPALAVFPGYPTLYLTPSAVFSGPASPPHALEPGRENRIPAPAIEQKAGVAFLRSLGVELPPRLRDRVRTLPYQITIHCALHKPPYACHAGEDCIVRAVAEAPDGHQETWTNQGWVDSTPKAARKSAHDKKGTITMYDEPSLQSVPALLEPLNLKPERFGRGLAARVTRKFPETFAAWLKSVPPHITVQLEGDLATLAKADVAGRVKLDVTETEIDWFDLRVVLDVSDTTLTQAEIQLLLQAKGNYVRLKGKGWRRLQFDLSEEENERLARLGLNPRGLSAEPQRLHALQLADEAAKKFLPEQQVKQIQRRVEELKTRVTPALPADMTAELRPYQLEGYHFLAYLSTNRFGGILADDMGLGKTLQTLLWLLWLRQQPHPAPHATRNTQHAPSLVVCPKSVMDNWHAEAARFTPGLRVRVWSAGELKHFGAELASADLHVLNYTQLRSLGESLAPARWLAVILDEGQYIKNPNSQTAQVARVLRAGHRLVLTGTPIENRLLDLWSLMAFAMPGVLGSRAQFANLYDAKDDPFARRRLAARVRPFVLRRTKAQVATDLPDRTEEDLFCDIEGEQKTLYRAELKRAQQLLLSIKTQKELAHQQFHFLTSLLRLRQICCHPRLMKPDSHGRSAKTEALLEQLEPLMEEGQKVLVFSQFVEMLDLLQPALEERGWPLFYLAGRTENRGELVKRFQETEGPAVFLISLKAGGFGLNLTAASYVMLFDPWWNPAVENQAIDRTHRIGQTRKVIAYRLLIKNSIEEKIRALQHRKKALAEDVLGEEKFAQSLTLEDLRFLFAE